jgi:hypothetical protein
MAPEESEAAGRSLGSLTVLASLAALLMLGQETPRIPPMHYANTPMTCPVGGEKFSALTLAHYSTFGSLPDGQPIGSVEFPTPLAECPGNGLVVYEEFSPAAVAKLGPLVASGAYKALRGTETSYYRAAWLAKSLDNPRQAAWLLLSATWEAKNAEPVGARAARYNAEFVEMVRALPFDSKDFESIALRSRAANALRELGRFDQAATLRASIEIDPAAGGAKGAENRKGWRGYLDALAAPIARRDPARYPIDLRGKQGAYRCLEADLARKRAQSPAPPPLSAFEAEYCQGPALAEAVERLRADLLQ